MTDIADTPPVIEQDRELTQDGPAVRLWMIDASAYIFRAYHALPPLTRKSDGLPVGLQVTARRHRDDILLRLARIHELSSPWTFPWD